MGASHEQWEPPPGFGVRQTSGALAMEASQPKAPEDWRSPRRYRAVRSFRVPMHARIRKTALHQPTHPLKVLSAREGTGKSPCRANGEPLSCGDETNKAQSLRRNAPVKSVFSTGPGRSGAGIVAQPMDQS